MSNLSKNIFVFLVLTVSLIVCQGQEVEIDRPNNETEINKPHDEAVKQFFTSGLTRIFWERIRPGANISEPCQRNIIRVLNGLREGSSWAYSCK